MTNTNTNGDSNMNANQNKTDWTKRDIGALWKREGKSQKYLSGYVKVDELGIERELKIVIFSNKNKKDNQKAPDYRIYISTPAEGSDSVAKTASVPKTSQPVKNVQSKVKEVESEDIL
jgi:uncharacterized protein (DUF736 family)